MALVGDTSAEPRLSVVRPTPLDLPAFLPYASCQLRAPYRVRVLLETQEEYVSKADEKDKKTSKAKPGLAHQTSRTRTESQERSRDESGVSAPAHTYSENSDIIVTAVQDSAGRLVELRLHRAREVPRLLVQIVALCVPYQPLLTRLSVRWGPLEGEVLYEIARLLPISQLTDLCLDDSPVPERNYPSLLEHARLRRLSLARCDLDDEDCARLAAALVHPRPASRHLRLLELVSNRIGDAGAVALGTALRSNRTLRHLGLAGNRVTDEGARPMLCSLAEFPLTYEEIKAQRRRLLEYLRLRKETAARIECELRVAIVMRDRVEQDTARGRRRTIAPLKLSKTSPTSGRMSATSGTSASNTDVIALRAETMAVEQMGEYTDPFATWETVTRDGRLYSVGNTTLCFLNVAHNELGHATVQTLLHVLRYQSGLRAGAGAAAGLVRVVLDGNPLPLACAEYEPCQELLERAVLQKVVKTKTAKTK